MTSIKKRLELLEEQYFPHSKQQQRGITFPEFCFVGLILSTYEDREKEAPPILLRELQRLRRRTMVG